RWMFLWEHDFEPVPGHASMPFVSLRCPRLVGAEKRPARIIEIWLGPSRIIAGVESPEAIQLYDVHSIILEVKKLRRHWPVRDQRHDGSQNHPYVIEFPGKHRPEMFAWVEPISQLKISMRTALALSPSYRGAKGGRYFPMPFVPLLGLDLVA